MLLDFYCIIVVNNIELYIKLIIEKGILLYLSISYLFKKGYICFLKILIIKDIKKVILS